MNNLIFQANSAGEKREGERVTINKEFDSFDAFIQEYVTNISRTGVFIKSVAPLAGTRRAMGRVNLVRLPPLHGVDERPRRGGAATGYVSCIP